MASFRNTLRSFIVVFILFHENVYGVSSYNNQTKPSSISLNALCVTTPHPEMCYKTMSPLIKFPQKNISTQIFVGLSMQASMREISGVAKGFAPNGTISQTIHNLKVKGINLKSPLESCRVFIDLALDNLNQSLAISSNMTSHESRENVKTWVSAADADLETCIDAFEYTPHEASKVVKDNLDNSIRLISNCLAIIYKTDDDVVDMHQSSIHSNKNKVTSDRRRPIWLPSNNDPRLLGSPRKLLMQQANIVVAADGSGNYKTIGEAIKAVPPYNNTRFVIYVKRGIYFENVRVDSTKWNVMVFGDGMYKTIVSASLNNASGIAGFDTSTFGVYGKGFIGRDMGFINTAGPTKGQATALAVVADRAIFYKCRIDAYQDSLFAQSSRQLYRLCLIYGTIDFIYGYAAAVFQRCTILVKRPLPGQYNVITANGKNQANTKSGFTLQNCNVNASGDLRGVRTFLGRPWRNYSTTIYMESILGSLIDPQGWSPWLPVKTPPDTIYYAEFNNKGPGAVNTSRVLWKGLRLDVSADEANKFTVGSLINGNEWIPATGIPFRSGL